jgi:hypothetical protein
MAYRSDAAALLQREAAIERELQTLLGPDGTALLHAERIAELTAELAKTRALEVRRDPAQPRKALKVRAASRCSASWEQMSGDDRVRRCAACRRNVYNFTSLSSEEVAATLIESEGKLGDRLFRRWDGSILARDCPRRRRRAVLAGMGVALWMMALFGVSTLASRQDTACGDPSEADVQKIVERRLKDVRRVPSREVSLDEVPVDLGAKLPPIGEGSERASDGEGTQE